MQWGYPADGLEANRQNGIWPVPSLSTNKYRSVLSEVGSVIDTGTHSSPLRILDVGASVGSPLQELARELTTRYDIPTQTVAVDIHPRAVTEVRRHSNADHAVQGVGQQLPFSQDYFDIVISKKLVAFLPPAEQRHILQEIVRVLASDGICVVELDPTGSDAMDTSELWIVSAAELHQVRQATNDFQTYPFPSKDATL